MILQSDASVTNLIKCSDVEGLLRIKDLNISIQIINKIKMNGSGNIAKSHFPNFNFLYNLIIIIICVNLYNQVVKLALILLL